MNDRIARLATLADMLRDAELARLKQAQDALTATENAQQKLIIARCQIAAAATVDPAHQAGADQIWLGWAGQRQSALSVQSANAAAATEAQMLRARRAVGRADVLGKIAKTL